MEDLIEVLAGVISTDVKNYLENHIIKFIYLLRNIGIKVSSAETIDALRALTMVDLSNRSQVRAVLGATLIKSTDDQFLFRQAFDLFFVPPEVRWRHIEERRKKIADKRARQQLADEELSFQGMKLDLSPEQKETYACMKPSDRKRLQDFLEKTSHGLKVDQSFLPLVERLVRGHLERWRRQMLGLPYDVIEYGETGDELLDSILQQLACGTGGDYDPILYEDLKNIADKDLPKAKRLTQELARKLATRISRRYRQSARQKRLDLRRTVRSNIRYGGTMLDLKYRAKRIHKPSLLLICDVSGSMSRYAGFVTQFIYGLSSAVGKIESFIFSEDLERITDYFQQDKTFEDVMSQVMNKSRVWGQGTHLGQALATLFSKYGHLVNSSTVVIILSDTKTLALDEAAQQLSILRGRVKEVLWLNTLHKEEWSALSSVALFSRYSQMFECNSLSHMERIMRSYPWTGPRYAV